MQGGMQSSVQSSMPPVVHGTPSHPSALVRHLDDLAQDIVAVPGAGGALLAAFAAQARALSMVVEAAKRAGGSPWPPHRSTAW